MYTYVHTYIYNVVKHTKKYSDTPSMILASVFADHRSSELEQPERSHKAESHFARRANHAAGAEPVYQINPNL